MLNASKSFILFIFIYISTVFAANSGFSIGTSGKGCRECRGTHSFKFSKPATLLLAYTFLGYSLDLCATHGDFSSSKYERTGCTGSGDKMTCMNYVFHVAVPSFCGSGPTVSLVKTEHCVNSFCASVDVLRLSCDKAVSCRADCLPRACGN